MNDKSPIEEVRNVRNRLSAYGCPTQALELIDAYADLLASRERAKPVAWHIVMIHDGEETEKVVFHKPLEYRFPAGSIFRPLYSHPSPTDADALAEAGRLLVSIHDDLCARIDREEGVDDAFDLWSAGIDRMKVALATHAQAAQPYHSKSEMKREETLMASAEQVTDGGRNMHYEGLFPGETEQDRDARLKAAQPAGEGS